MATERENEASRWALVDLLVENGIPEGDVVIAELTDGRWVAVMMYAGKARWAPGELYQDPMAWRDSEWPVYTGKIAKLNGEALN